MVCLLLEPVVLVVMSSPTAVSRMDILRIYGFYSIRALFQRGELHLKHRQIPGKFGPKDVSV